MGETKNVPKAKGAEKLAHEGLEGHGGYPKTKPEERLSHVTGEMEPANPLANKSGKPVAAPKVETDLDEESPDQESDDEDRDQEDEE